MFYCGIDIAKYKHEAAVIDEAGMALLDSISTRDLVYCWRCSSDWTSPKTP